MKRIRVGVFGLGRGASYFSSILMNQGEIVAVCEKNEEILQRALEKLDSEVAVYRDFDSFIEHDMDAVFLANYFHEHAPYAIRCLEKGIHVLSECTSNGTMAEGVALVRAAEKSNAIYMLAENYPFMLFNQEMRRIYQGGTLGKVLFAEGEYNHPVDPENHEECRSLRPFLNHWRNYLPRTYYITHSLAPLMHITGSTPRRVTAMPVYFPNAGDGLFGPFVGDRAAIITCLNDDNSVFRVTGCAGFGAHGNSYRICAENGQVENVRGTDGKIMLRYNSWKIPEGAEEVSFYAPDWQDKDAELIKKTGHGGGDFFVMREFFDCIRTGRKPDFDVYFATTNASVAILSHRSLMEKGVPYDIPDFHKEEDRKKYENDNILPIPKSDGTPANQPYCSNPDYMPTKEQCEEYLKLVNGRINE